MVNANRAHLISSRCKPFVTSKDTRSSTNTTTAMHLDDAYLLRQPLGAECFVRCSWMACNTQRLVRCPPPTYGCGCMPHSTGTRRTHSPAPRSVVTRGFDVHGVSSFAPDAHNLKAVVFVHLTRQTVRRLQSGALHSGPTNDKTASTYNANALGHTRRMRTHQHAVRVRLAVAQPYQLSALQFNDLGLPVRT